MKWDGDVTEAVASETHVPVAPQPTRAGRYVLGTAIALLGVGLAVGASAWLRSDARLLVVGAIRAMATPHTSTLATLAGVALAVAPTVFACVVWRLDQVRGPKSDF